MDTRKRSLTLLMAALFAVAACSQSTASQAPAASAAAPSAEASTAPSEAPAASASAAPLAADPAEAVITNIEPNAEITVWTFWLSPTFDNYLKDTFARFEQTYPG